MNEQFSHNPSVVPGPTNADVVALIKKMQQQLEFLEKKIDTLINQSQEKPFQEKRFSKPFRSFGHSPRYGKGEHDRSPRERDFDQGRHSEKRPGDQNRSFGQKKKPFFHKRKDRG